METKLAKLTIADKKQAKPASEFVSKSNGLAAAYALTIKPGATAYRYDVEITRQHPKDPAKNRSLTKRAPDDGEASLRKILCAEVVTAFKNKTNNFGLGPKGQFVCYDGTKNLYLPQPMALQAGKKSMEFTAADLSPFGKNQILDCSVLVEISQSQQHEINFSNVASMMDTREGPADRSAAQFLDLLTSQYAVSSLEYISLGLGKLYQRRGEVMQNKTMELRSGLSKGIQLVDNNGKTNVALMIDSKKTAFYRSDFLHMIFKDANILGQNFQQSHSVMSQLYNGVRCSLKHAQSRTVVITKISTELAKNIKVDQHGSMPEYFKKKYNVVIDPSLPVIETEKAPFPMDLLIVCPNQRVPMEKLDDNVRRTILMGTAVPPEDRFKRIRQEVEQAKLVPSNNIMEFFGVKVTVPKMLEATIQVRASPGVMIQKNGKSEVLATNNASWKMNGVNLFAPTQFLIGGFPVLYPRGFEPKQFVQGLLLTASKLGLKIGAPTYQQVDLSNYKAMQKKFAELGAAKTRFVLVFDFQRNKSHHDLKLLEREYSVLTMQIKIETTKRQGLGQTYENLVLKMNAKASGVNFIPMIEKCGGELSLQRKVLVIGLDIGLPARGSPKELYELRKKDLADVSSHEPAVVGVCGNWGKQPATILGDYYYQPATHETLDSELLKQNFSRVLDRFMKARNTWPEHIVVFRDGVGNGQLHQTTQAEYPVLEHVCKQFKGDNPMPNIIYIIVTKKHNKRFVNGAAGKEANPVPNSVIDRGVVRPDLCEFYMQSHRPLKGTAKIPHYCVMMNPKNMSMDALQAFCNHLCLDHQVVTSAVSLPEPIYHAKEQTKRGRNNLNAKRLANDNQVPRAANGLVDCQKVTQALGYANVALGQIKFAA